MNFEQPTSERTYRARIGPHKILFSLSSFMESGPTGYRVELHLDIGTDDPLKHTFYVRCQHGWEEEVPFESVEEQVKGVLERMTSATQDLLNPNRVDTGPRTTFWERL